ncbi:MAG: FAD-dependent oxidoreductase [Chloroflexi bacterium]|nr:FAD-dependent oxidoreductase [Chloroflexota bacterium]
MTVPDLTARPIRIAIIGSGPAAFYAADYLLKPRARVAQIDLFDKLPTPFGLVRAGVAPDHQKIKSVTKIYDAVAANPNFRFFGNVEYGKHLSLADLKNYYHQILFATGAQTDRKMDIPGEELRGSYTATEFVAWYNGHPDYREREFDLAQECAAIVGVGNVAVDVARILSRTPDELAKTDIADYALDALRASQLKKIYLLGRRGPAQAAFTNPEIKELGELADADAIIAPQEAALDELSRAALDREKDPLTLKKTQLIQEIAARAPAGKSRQLYIRFLVSPVELIGDSNGHVIKMRVVKNKLAQSESGSLNAHATDQFEELPVNLVFRSVGYRGIALPEIPFNDRFGTILNQMGRVLDSTTHSPVTGLFCSGWIKRGPSGVIGTNKPDSVETANAMLEDIAAEKMFAPAHARAEQAAEFIRARQPNFFSYADWKKLDALEVARGAAQGRPRVKFTSVPEMIAALGRA